MISRQTLLTGATIVAAIIAAVWLKRRDMEQRPAPTVVNHHVTQPTLETSSLVHKVPELHPEQVERVIHFRGDRVLAKINGVGITARDLTPLSDAARQTDLAMPASSYQYLLDRAINRELAFQAAAVRGVTLTEFQQQQLERIQQQAYSRDLGAAQPVLARPNETAALEEQIAFDQRDAAGLLLQNSLLNHAGGTGPHVTEQQVQDYYQQHAAEYGPLPADSAARAEAWRNIDNQIRQNLAPASLQAHQGQLEQYLAELRKAANIEVTPL